VLVAVLGTAGAFALGRATSHRSSAATTTTTTVPTRHPSTTTTTVPKQAPSTTTTPAKATTTTTAPKGGGATTTTTTAPNGTGGTTTTTTAPTTVNLATEPATTVLFLAVSAMNKAQTVHFAQTETSTATVGGKKSTETVIDTQVAGQTAGTQKVTYKGTTATFTGTEIYVDKIAYMTGNAAGLKALFGTTATKAAADAGKWISVTSTNEVYATAQANMTLSQVEGQFEPATPLTSLGVSTVDGQPVVGIRGSLPTEFTQGTTSVTGTAVLYVLDKAPYTPVQMTFSAARSTTQHSATATEKATTNFSDWGSPLTVSAPPGAIPASTVEPAKGSSGTTGTTGSPPPTTSTIRFAPTDGRPPARARH
jgi:hypothetical protein